MTISAKPTPQAIRQARIDNPKLRERDLAVQLGITEADYAAAHVGESVTRIEPRVEELLPRLEALGEVMALTRNDSAVHEKIGVYDKIVVDKHSAMALGAQIDLRIFPKVWRHGFAVEKRGEDGEIRRSLQFFDKSGDAVHKIHLRAASDLKAYDALVADFTAADQSQVVSTEPRPSEAANDDRPAVDDDRLRARWSAMTDTHQFVGILKDLGITRHEAVTAIGKDFARELAPGAVPAMMARAVETELPIMVLVGSRGCIQIHSGPIVNVKPMGPWLNVMDPTFHLHLRTDHIAQAWAVRKPTKDGHVTSIEAYDTNGSMIIQFFGKRMEGFAERPVWREIVESLPKHPAANSSAA
ncbi:MAG: hemin-degrading factor [Rhizobiaceae bacterium]|nr:hemin-degrading factor [Rhizobiaceae bacterium]MCV0408770.1 hemin-degrading factor [Rhizobiaceae bacterium]